MKLVVRWQRASHQIISKDTKCTEYLLGTEFLERGEEVSLLVNVTERIEADHIGIESCRQTKEAPRTEKKYVECFDGHRWHYSYNQGLPSLLLNCT